MKLKNQSILVTGGASGIGHHAGLALAAEGANILAADFNIDGAASASWSVVPA
jgi:NAD(P)-dependent dehydrogenase (short-subunit alcohol dehydrogenase family)